ncbi:hypothetical protein [Methyloglobulus sp.]|uniref:hypothetical protein n=1 Tax=Methyloglobulus sp. TaxID=2518622 RepID=UPI003989E1FB
MIYSHAERGNDALCQITWSIFSKIVIPTWIGGEDSISSPAVPTSREGGSAVNGQESLPPPSLEVAGIQVPWMDLSLPSMALDTRFPAGMTSLLLI